MDPSEAAAPGTEVRDTERPVDRHGGDPADRPPVEQLLGHNLPFQHPSDDLLPLPVLDLEEGRQLALGEVAAGEGDEGDPLWVAAPPPERPDDLFPPAQVSGHRSAAVPTEAVAFHIAGPSVVARRNTSCSTPRIVTGRLSAAQRAHHLRARVRRARRGSSPRPSPSRDRR